MIFFSPFAGFMVFIRAEAVHYHPNTGVELSRTKALRAEFARFGSEYTVRDPVTGRNDQFADITGHFFDTDSAAEELHWDADEKESVEQRLLWLCERRPDQIRFVEPMVPIVMAPWPTYDQCDHRQAVALAQQLGLVREALVYEQANKQRPAVLEPLESAIAEMVDEDGEPLPQPDLLNVSVPVREPLVTAKGGESRVVVV